MRILRDGFYRLGDPRILQAPRLARAWDDLTRILVSALDRWRDHARAVVIDSTVLRATGGVWHKKHRAAGVVPHTSIDTAAGWAKSGWHGWVYGWKPRVACAASPGWLPLAAELTAAPEDDNAVAPAPIRALVAAQDVRRGGQRADRGWRDRDPDLAALCAARSCVLVVPQGGRYPHADDGTAVRRLPHKTRSVTIEDVNEQFTGIVGAHAHARHLATIDWLSR